MAMSEATRGVRRLGSPPRDRLGGRRALARVSGAGQARRRRSCVPATIFFLAWYFGFVILAGYAPDFMGEEFLTDGLTVGYVLALTQFVMAWVLGALVPAQVATATSTRSPSAPPQVALQAGSGALSALDAAAMRR